MCTCSELRRWTSIYAHVQLSRVYLVSTLDITHMIMCTRLSPIFSRESLGMRLVQDNNANCHSQAVRHVAYRHFTHLPHLSTLAMHHATHDSTTHMVLPCFILASSPGHSQILSCSRGEKSNEGCVDVSGRRYACTSTEESSRLRASALLCVKTSLRTRTTILKDGETDCKATCRYVQVIYAVQP